MWFVKKDENKNLITTRLDSEDYIALEKFREEQRLLRMIESNKSCEIMLKRIFGIMSILVIFLIGFVLINSILSSQVHIIYKDGNKALDYKASTLVYMNDNINGLSSFGHPNWLSGQGCAP